jgi:hypothetical protein
MLRAFQEESGQVEDLAPFKIQRRFLGKVLAAFALAQWMNLDVLGLFAGLKRATGVARLTAG